jgi:ribonuclease HI
VIFTAWTDGSGTTADRDAGIGVVVLCDDQVVCEASSPIGLGTNNVAEVRAVGRALALVWRIAGSRRQALTIYSDSEFAIGALTKPWNLRSNPALTALVAEVRAEVARWPALRFEHVAGHAGIELNERADVLAVRARRAGIAMRTEGQERKTA